MACRSLQINFVLSGRLIYLINCLNSNLDTKQKKIQKASKIANRVQTKLEVSHNYVFLLICIGESLPVKRNLIIKSREMKIEIINKEDLEVFRIALLKDIAALLPEKHEPLKDWLKGPEVRQIMGISAGTLQNLRIKGVLAFTKIGGTYYYRSVDLKKMLDRK
jgi:hypothetical protein